MILWFFILAKERSQKMSYTIQNSYCMIRNRIYNLYRRPKYVSFIERSLYSDIFVFADAMKKLGFMTIIELNMYYCLHDMFINNSNKVDRFIYVLHQRSV